MGRMDAQEKTEAGPKSAEIEITPEMIEAGYSPYAVRASIFESIDDIKAAVREIYLAMEGERRRQKCRAP